VKALDVISGALVLLGIRVAESPIEANESQDGLNALNDMLAEWNTDGIRLGFETLSGVEEELYVPDGALGAIKANLAVYIAPEYERSVSPALAQRASDGKRTARSLEPMGGSQYPDTLPVGSGNRHGGHSSDGDSAGNTSNRRFYPPNSRSRCN